MFLTGPRSGFFVQCRWFQSSIFLLNDDKICKNTSFDRPMIQLWEPVVRNKLGFKSLKTCAVSMSDTGKQQFTANRNIYQLSNIDRSVLDDIHL